MGTEEAFSELMAFALETHIRTLALFDLIHELHPEVSKEKFDELIERRRKTMVADLKAEKWQDFHLLNILLLAAQLNERDAS